MLKGHSAGAVYTEASMGNETAVSGLQYSQGYRSPPPHDENQQARNTPTNTTSPYFLPGNARPSPSLSASSSPLHHTEDQRRGGYCFSPMRNPDQQRTTRLRQHPQHQADRGGGYYNFQPPGRQTVMQQHPNYMQGKK